VERFRVERRYPEDFAREYPEAVDPLDGSRKSMKRRPS